MKCGAVLIENREEILKDIDKIVNRHMYYLPNFEFLHVKPTKINTLSDYNNLLTSADWWRTIPFDKVLIIQHDSGLLRDGIEEFLEWDYVGSPWMFQLHGGNGGLSLRTKSAMIKTIESFVYNESVHGNEDVYFSNHIRKVGGKLAPRDVCFKFSCETIYREGTLGYHAINRYFKPEEVKRIMTQYERPR